MENKTVSLASLREINQLAMDERVLKGHPGNLQLWWNRSPILSSEKLLQEVAGEYIQAEKSPVIVDPFSGFGGLVMAADSTGIPVCAGDLNSVAVLLTSAATDVPRRFSGRKPVSGADISHDCKGTLGLAEDVRFYGKWMISEAQSRLAGFYPQRHLEMPDGSKQAIKTFAWIWVRTVPCPNPACKCEMPLANSYVLSRSKRREYFARPVQKDSRVEFEIHKGICPENEQTNKMGGKGAKFRCPFCGEITTDEYIRQIAGEGRMGVQLMAVVEESGGRRSYRVPAEDDLRASETLMGGIDIPVGSLPDNPRWFTPPRFGKKAYADLYTHRQMCLMSTLCSLVREAGEKAYRDALGRQMGDDGIPLSDGGSGALAYGQAIQLYLSLVVGKIANFQSEICSWDNRKGNVRGAFLMQALPMTWVFAEGNPFSSVTGNINGLLSGVADTITGLRGTGAVNVRQADGINFPFPDHSILFTELPYYDNVGYADLSDYFYIWLRKCLKDVYPALFSKLVTSKEELSSIPEHFGKDAAMAKKTYEEGIRQFFTNFAPAAATNVPSMVFFLYTKADEEAILDPSDRDGLSSWENILSGIVDAGFQIMALLPARTEKHDAHSASTRICIIFQKRGENAQQVTRRGFVSAMKKELRELLDDRFVEQTDPWDRHIVGMGHGLGVFSRYRRIINADGSNMNVHEALQSIRAEVDAFLSEQATQGDYSETF